MRPAYPWLCQGDVFEQVPVVTFGRNEAGAHNFRSDFVAALLTEGCQLDKPRQAGEQLSISFFQLAPIAPFETSNISSSIRGQLRSRRHTNPSGLLRRYVGKDTDLARYSAENLRAIEHRINTMPRRSLHWSTAHEVYTRAVAMTG